jgi:hypothetical protein
MPSEPTPSVVDELHAKVKPQWADAIDRAVEICRAEQRLYMESSRQCDASGNTVGGGHDAASAMACDRIAQALAALKSERRAVERATYRVAAPKEYPWGKFTLWVFPEDEIDVMANGQMLVTTRSPDHVAMKHGQRSRKELYWRTDFHVDIPAEDLVPMLYESNQPTNQGESAMTTDNQPTATDAPATAHHIIVNGSPFAIYVSWVTYEYIVQLALMRGTPSMTRDWTPECKHGRDGRIVHPGDRIDLESGMVFTVAHTGNA